MCLLRCQRHRTSLFFGAGVPLAGLVDYFPKDCHVGVSLVVSLFVRNRVHAVACRCGRLCGNLGTVHVNSLAGYPDDHRWYDQVPGADIR